MQRPPFFLPGPRYLIATGVAWLAYGGYLTATGWWEWAHEPSGLGLLVWPALGLAALVGGLGLVAARPFSRGLIVSLAGLGLVGPVPFPRTLALPTVVLWWPTLVLAVFFLWSVVLVAVLWPARPIARSAAG